ncbi:hypothetical protein Tco_0811688, partial [Tanacetum coccineum]
FMMDDPNVTMKEHIKLQAEKAQRRGRKFNWETATYDMALSPRDQRHQYCRFKGLEYSEGNIADFEERMLMEHRDAQGQSVFTSHAWRRLFEVRGPLVHELILELFSTFRFGETVLDLDTIGGVTAKSARQIPDKADLSAYSRGISSEGDFLGITPSYTTIRDPMLRLCHRLITCIIAGRSQAPDKICDKLDDTWAWVAPGPERQSDAAAGALEVAEGAPDVDEGAQAVAAPVQAPQPPLAAT